MSGYIADTSVFIAAEQRRALNPPPDGEARISVATLTELLVGVGRAPDGPLRTLREQTLQTARRFIALPFDSAVAEQLARLLIAARNGRRRAGAMDAIIAATARVRNRSVGGRQDDSIMKSPWLEWLAK